MSVRPLRVTFVLPFLSLTGGIRVVFEHTRMCAGSATRSASWRPGCAGDLRGRRAAGKRSARGGSIATSSGPGGRSTTSACATRSIFVPALEPEFFPDGDVLVATSWPTAASVAAAPARCGRGAYFIQHSRCSPPGSKESVDATWRLPLERIVIASWLLRLARDRFGVPAWGPIVNGVNIEQFTGSVRPRRGPATVGMLYEIQPWKGLEEGLAAIEAARRLVPDLRLRMFGRYRLRHALRPGTVAHGHGRCAVQLDNRRGFGLKQHVIEDDDLAPVRSVGVGAPARALPRSPLGACTVRCVS